jgi:hypothetical protein
MKRKHLGPRSVHTTEASREVASFARLSAAYGIVERLDEIGRVISADAKL